MTATGTIHMIYCVQQATGTDIGVAQVLAGVPEIVDVSGIPIAEVLRQVPGLLATVDAARSDPDNLYMTFDTAGGLDSAVWPEDKTPQDVSAGQSATPAIAVDIDFSQNVSLWDYDSVSSDDLLGSVTMLESEQGAGQLAKLASSSVENSFYYVVYSVE